MARLIMRRGPQPGKVFDLKDEIVTIGSGSKNTIVILDNDISREHCRLIRIMADYELSDLNTSRGTFVSGQRVKDGWLLKPGNLIELGETVTFEYERAGAEDEMENAQPAPQPVHTEKPDPSSHPSLVMVSGPKAGHVFPLKTQTVRVGRDVTNDIVIQDPEVSRFHAHLKWADTSYLLEDLGSTNGTMVNGTTLPASTPKLLHTNDLVHFAEQAEFRYTWQPDDVQTDSSPKPIKVSARLATRELTHLDTNEAKLFIPKNQRQTSKLGTGLQPGVLEDHIFVTYAREEWETIVAPLTAIIQDAGYNVWVDQYLVQGGDDWMLAVEQALSECWLLVVIVSPESLNSRHVRLAYRYFFNREKPVIPLLYANVEELPLELKKFKLIRYDTHNRKETFDNMIAEIQQRQKS